jgi:predicted acylesterase/phospholipase RssA
MSDDFDEIEGAKESSALFDFGSPMPRLQPKSNSILPVNFKYVVFSGGGTKLFGFIGALEELQFRNVKGIGGCSAGALMAVLCAGSNFDVEFIRNVMHSFDFQSLPSWFSFEKIMKVFETAGFYHREDEHMRGFFNSFLIPLFGSRDATLHDLWTQTGVHVRIQSTNILTNSVVVFDHVDYPDVKIRDALWASMCVPYLMEIPLINGDMLCVDGGMISSIPYFLYDPKETLCISIADHHETVLETKKAALKHGFGSPHTNIISQHIALITLLLSTPNMFNSRVFEDAYKETTMLNISIERSFVDTDISTEVKLSMEDTGRIAARNFISQQILHWSLACFVLSSSVEKEAQDPLASSSTTPCSSPPPPLEAFDVEQ